MLKTLIVLPDGTELYSGAGEKNVILSATVTQCVNSGTELTLGSCCSSMLEAELLTPEGDLTVKAGDQVTVCKVDDNGTRHKLGVFILETPTRSGAHTMGVTAYDRISLLDRDMTLWVEGLDAWPYSLYDLAKMVCGECGLTLKNTELPNGGWAVQRFSADGVTGRQLMQWIGEAAGRFCRADADGLVEFAWYTEAAGFSVGPEARCAMTAGYADGALSILAEDWTVTAGDGEVSVTAESLRVSGDGAGAVELADSVQYFFYQNGLRYEDYRVAAVEKVQIQKSQEDVGTVYPDSAEALNTYRITGNLLLSANSAEDLEPVAQTLYEHLRGITYTPFKAVIPASVHIQAGHILSLTDRNGVTITGFVMSKKQSGQKDTLECTGSASRDSTSAVNAQSFKAWTGKVLNLRTDVDGLMVENADTTGRVARIGLDLENIQTEVSAQQTDLEQVTQSVTTLTQSAEQVAIQVKDMADNGVEKVTTSTGYTFDAGGLRIRKSGEQMENRLDNTGMYVERSVGEDTETVLQANDAGVVAADVSVRNYLIVGTHARFEDYTDGSDSQRTACFWIGGE